MLRAPFLPDAATELQLRSDEQPATPSLFGVEEPLLPEAAKELQPSSAEQPATPSLFDAEEPLLPELERANETSVSRSTQSAPTEKRDNQRVRGATAMCKIQSPAATEHKKHMRQREIQTNKQTEPDTEHIASEGTSNHNERDNERRK